MGIQKVLPYSGTDDPLLVVPQLTHIYIGLDGVPISNESNDTAGTIGRSLSVAVVVSSCGGSSQHQQEEVGSRINRRT
jgi:hypothetical protein